MNIMICNGLSYSASNLGKVGFLSPFSFCVLLLNYDFQKIYGYDVVFNVLLADNSIANSHFCYGLDIIKDLVDFVMP